MNPRSRPHAVCPQFSRPADDPPRPRKDAIFYYYLPSQQLKYQRPRGHYIEALVCPQNALYTC